MTPGFGRTLKLQKWSCSTTKPSCAWKTTATYKADAKNKVTVAITAPRGTSHWRVVAPQTKAGSTAVTASRTFKRSK